MTSPTFALGIPHASWIPERAAMMAELREQIGIAAGPSSVPWPSGVQASEFSDREHWESWFPKILRWAVDTGAHYLVVLQDDVEIAPSFWPSLRAMCAAWPRDFISLAATHSLGPEVARQGRRSYLQAKVVGWGWCAPMGVVRELLGWAVEGRQLEAFRAAHPNDGEDTMAALFLASRKILPRCPVPTIVDHRFVASTNVGFDDHTHRRSTVTWRGYSPADMAEPGWWRTTAAELPADDWRRCWFCGARPGVQRSAATGAEICGVCVTTFVGAQFGLQMRA